MSLVRKDSKENALKDTYNMKRPKVMRGPRHFSKESRCWKILPQSGHFPWDALKVEIPK